MKIVEMTYTVEESGEITIPSDMLQKMGIHPGELVTVAYLTSDGRENDFREFLVATESFSQTEEMQEIRLPAELLERAGLDADIQILCLDGCVLICRDQTLNVDELIAVMEAQNLAIDLVGRLDQDPAAARQQLDQYLSENVEE